MKVFRLSSVHVLVAVLASVAASCSEGDAADQVPQRAEGPPEHSVNLQRIRTLDCKGAFVCKQGQLLFITGQGKGHCLDLAGDPSSPVVRSDSLPPAWDVAVKGNYAFVVANSRMLSVYDMGDGKTWRRIADCSTPAAGPMKVGPTQIVDYTDPTYGARIRQLRKDDGHEHNFYYYRDPWNADGTRMLGIQSDLDQKH